MQKARPDFRASGRRRSAVPASSPRNIDVTIEKLVYGGEGLAHHDGATVFVPFVLPKEKASVEVIEQKKKFIRGRLERVLDASPDRVAALCPHFSVCGGCDYQHIPYEAQLQFKTDILRETLRRLGQVDWTGEIRRHASEAWRYRNRAQWKVGRIAPRAGTFRSDALGIGYFRARSTSLCAVDNCPILAPVLLKTLLALRDALRAGRLPVGLHEIEAFTNERPEGDSARLLLTLTFSGFPPRAAEAANRIREIVPEAESILFHDPARERMELFGPGFIALRVGERTFRTGHFSFFQVNRFLAEDLAREVMEGVPDGAIALDLFAGVGLFTVPLAERFARVIAVESNPAAARDLETNAHGNQAIEVRAEDVDDFLRKFRGEPDLVVVDPPRAGLTASTTQRLTEIAPQKLVYVSCEPPTMARDLRLLVDGGYEIAEVHFFDLFPQTFHIEAVAKLRRRT